LIAGSQPYSWVVASTTITLIGKPGCHLCDDARAVITRVVDEVGGNMTVAELSILDDEALLARYEEEIPVVLINGAVHTIWRVDAARLRHVLDETVSRRRSHD
jgi:hypothetical protein